jgi:DNA-binding NarL/FixJ family response regulator
MKILMVDDHPLMSDAVKTVLQVVDSSNAVTAVTTLSEACKTLDRTFDFDLVLLDLGLPDSQGLTGLTMLKAKFPEVPVVVMSADRQPELILECLEFGAAGYIPKTCQRDVLINALRLVSSGSVYIPPEALAQATSASLQFGRPGSSNQMIFNQLELTQRQQEVLRLILRGLPNKSICKLMDLAEGTVKVHVSAVLKALNATTRTQAVVAASRLGLKFD